jgi:hypothetical protein
MHTKKPIMKNTSHIAIIQEQEYARIKKTFSRRAKEILFHSVIDFNQN